MSSALGCGGTGTWSNPRRRSDRCNGSGISATHGIVLCASLKMYKLCSPSAVSMRNSQPFPPQLSLIVMRKSLAGLAQFPLAAIRLIHTHVDFLSKCQCITALSLIDRAARHCPDGWLSREDSWSSASTYLFCWSNHLWTSSWGEREW